MIEDLDAKILSFLEHGPATPDEVATELGIAWATAQGYLLKLAGMGKVFASRKGRVNVYFLRAPRQVTFNVPAWAKIWGLEELADELAAYFPAGVSAAEMIVKERRRA